MPKAKVQEGVESDVEEVTPTPAQPVESFKVFDNTNTFIRTYDTETHGEDAGKLAKQFAKKIGGKIAKE